MDFFLACMPRVQVDGSVPDGMVTIADGVKSLILTHTHTHDDATLFTAVYNVRCTPFDRRIYNVQCIKTNETTEKIESTVKPNKSMLIKTRRC